MGKQVETFTSAEFGSIRAFNGEDGEPWFVASDIAKTLGYRDAEKMTRRLDDDEKGTRSVGTPGGVQQMTVITEAGLYAAILGSKIEGAQRFKRWVTHEVLPSIRKHGGYMAGQEAMSPEQMLAASMRWLESRIKEQEAQLEAQKPKVLFADARLREDGYLGKTGQNRNVPLQRWVEQGLFRIKETAITHPDGHVTINRTPKVTGKGQTYFLKKYAPNCLDITVTTLEVGE